MLLDRLRTELTRSELLDDTSVTKGYASDQTAGLTGVPPKAVLRPKSTASVQTILRHANDLRVPVVPRGAGSGLAGGAACTDGAVVLSTEALTAVRHVDRGNRYAVVEAGLITQQLKDSAAEVGLWYPPDPASSEFSTIGGNVATNAGGMCCVKYGVTRDYVLGLEVVLADGEVIRTGRRTRKGVAGLDLTSLFVGSEGALGVITEVTVRLVPEQPSRTTIAATFGSVFEACDAVSAVLGRGLTPSLLELMDRPTLAAIEAFTPMGFEDAGAVLLAETDAHGSGEADAIKDLFNETGADFVGMTEDPREGAGLLLSRKRAYPALEAQGHALLDDVAVPPSALSDLFSAIASIADRNDVVIATFGHAGEGNLHPTIVYDPDGQQRARRAFDEILETALKLDGTVTGEHGIGLLKRDQLAKELGERASQLSWAVKRVFDPRNILNPGKALATHS